MTQAERTEQMIAALPREVYDVRDLIVHTRIMEAHARDLAVKIDTIMRYIRTQEISYGAMSEIRRIYNEGDPNAEA